MQVELLEKLRAQLRRDSSDVDVSFLLSVAVREPLLVYGHDRSRLRGLLSRNQGGGGVRERLIADAAEQLLAKSSTPSRGLRRPAPGGTDRVVGSPAAPTDSAAERKRRAEADTLPSNLAENEGDRDE